MNPGLSTPFQIILAYPQAEYTEYLAQLLNSAGFGDSPTVCHDLNQLFDLASPNDSSTNTLLITDLIWDGNDCSEVLLSLTLNNPNLAPAIISNHDLTQILPAFFPIPLVQGFEDATAIIKVLTSHIEDLRGQTVGAYQVQEFRGLTYLARTYAAYQPTIRREVHLNIQAATASPDEKEMFRRIGRAQGGNIHPNIYSIFEEGEHQGRFFLTQEPVNAPTLFQLGLQDFTFDARLLARVLHTSTVALNHLHQNKVSHLLISPAHITLSSEGVIKMLNTALPPEHPMPDPNEEVAALARMLKSFIPPEESTDSQLAGLLEQMEAGQISLEAALTRSQAVDLALAPEKFVPQRQEALKAHAEVQKARKTSTYALYGFSAALTLVTLFIIWKVLFGVVLELPGTDFQNQCLIPAGKVTLPGGATVEVKAFYMDEMEVTIGQYEKFIEATRGQDIRGLLPPDWHVSKSSFEPDDWKKILISLKKRGFYERVGERLNRDHPIFNIDYADAYAYAKWAGKRLPKETEWQRAAAGNENVRFPWGNDVERKFTNTGLDMNNDKKKDISAASVDGFRGPAPVDQFEKSVRDVSPFGVRYLGGNVSEWVETSPEMSGKDADYRYYVRGGNFNTPVLVPNQSRVTQNAETRQPFIGLRCVSDSPIGKIVSPP
jgi:formylglycine-generating enzyme required for sulfatase activity